MDKFLCIIYPVVNMHTQLSAGHTHCKQLLTLFMQLNIRHLWQLLTRKVMKVLSFK